MVMDDDCSVCCLLQDSYNNLTKIVEYIDQSCAKQKVKRDFGLDKSYIIRELTSIQQMQRYHQYFHSTGMSLNDSESVVDSLSTAPKPKRFRKPE